MELWAIWGYLWYLWYPFLVTRNYLNTFKGGGKVPQAEFEKYTTLSPQPTKTIDPTHILFVHFIYAEYYILHETTCMLEKLKKCVKTILLKRLKRLNVSYFYAKRNILILRQIKIYYLNFILRSSKGAKKAQYVIHISRPPSVTIGGRLAAPRVSEYPLLCGGPNIQGVL